MDGYRTEGTAIARLYGRDATKIIAWVFLWNTEELTILWLGRKRTVRFIDPPIDEDRFCPSLQANREVLARISAARARPLPKS